MTDTASETGREGLVDQAASQVQGAAASAQEKAVELKAQGRIKAIGAGMNQWEMLARFAEVGEFDCFILAGRWTLLDRSGAEVLLPLCAEKGISVIAAGVYQSGLLADPRPGVSDNYAPVHADRLKRALELQAICAEHGVPLRAAAVQFPFSHPAVTSVIVGARTPEEVDDAVEMMSHPIPEALWERLR